MSSNKKKPDTFRIAHYQLAKARMKKALQLNGELTPILNGIKELNSRSLEKKRQINDRKVSIEAMERFIKLKLPKLLSNSKYEVVKPSKKKSFELKGVDIIVSPDVIIKIDVDGQIVIGGFKLHVSKSNAFNREQQQIVSSSLYKYLETEIAIDGEIVLPELCFSLDIFGNGFVATSSNYENTIKNIESLCEEIKMYWNVA